MAATTYFMNTPELLYLIGRACCPAWHYYNRNEVLFQSDLPEVLALRTVSTSFYHHFCRPFPRTALCIFSAHQLQSLFLDIIAFEEKVCRCSLSGGHHTRKHVNFLNLYLLDVQLHTESHNNTQLWALAQVATRYMTSWTELNVIIDEDSATTALARIGHWWIPGQCSIRTLRLKDEYCYGLGQHGVAHLFGPTPWDSNPWIQYGLTSFSRVRPLLIKTPAFPYPVPFDIDLEDFPNADALGVFLTSYDFSPHEEAFYFHIADVLPYLRRFYLQYLYWHPLAITWADPDGGTGSGRMFYAFGPQPSGGGLPHITGHNKLDHFDGQHFDTDPFSDVVGPYTPDPNDPLSPPEYVKPVFINCSIEGPYHLLPVDP